MRPHGISHTSFLDYSRDLRQQVTTTFLDFSVAFSPCITFLFVEPRFRYPFLSPLPHDSQAWESLLGSPVAGAPEDLHLRCTTCSSYQKGEQISPFSLSLQDYLLF